MASDPKDLILGILIAINQGNMPRLSTNNEYRSFLNILINDNLVNIIMDCNKIDQILDKGNLIPSGKSGSRSRQWYDISLDPLEKYLQIKPGPKLINYIKEYQNLLNLSIPQVTDLSNILNKMIMDAISKLKNDIFVKIGGISNVNYDSNNRWLQGEVYFYNYLNKFVYQQNLPHVTTIIYDKKCQHPLSPGLSRIKVDSPSETPQEKQDLEMYFQDRIAKRVKNNRLIDYTILITENMGNSKSLMQFLKDMNNLPSDDKDIISIQILFQLIYTLEIFRQLKFVHNDLHLGNIYIEELKIPTDYYYIINDKKIIHLRTKYLLRIFDFDRSYKLDDLTYNKSTSVDNYPFNIGNELNFDFFYVLRWLEFYFSKEPKIQYLSLANIINIIFYGKKGTENKYPQITTKGKLVPPWYQSPEMIKENKKVLNGMKINTTEWLQGVNKKYLGKLYLLSGITFYETTKVMPIEKTSEIFFDTLIDTNVLRNLIEQNLSWNKLSIFEQLIVCPPIVSREKYKKELVNYFKEKIGIYEKESKITPPITESIAIDKGLVPPTKPVDETPAIAPTKPVDKTPAIAPTKPVDKTPAIAPTKPIDSDSPIVKKKKLDEQEGGTDYYKKYIKYKKKYLQLAYSNGYFTK